MQSRSIVTGPLRGVNGLLTDSMKNSKYRSVSTPRTPIIRIIPTQV